MEITGELYFKIISSFILSVSELSGLILLSNITNGLFIARGCRTAINHEFDRDKALMCAIALGNRKFAFEVLPDMIEKYAKEVPLC